MDSHMLSPSEPRVSTRQGNKPAKSNGSVSLTPEEYARAVLEYSQLSTGAGQNHIDLARFLNDHPTTIDIDTTQFMNGESITSTTVDIDRHVVTLYPLNVVDDRQSTAPSVASAAPKVDDTVLDPDPADERDHEPRRFQRYHKPEDIFRHTIGANKPQGCIIFMQGYMSAAWINHVGARHRVDPEFFCRHLDFRPPGDILNNFSVPALPSSSWHLVELPIFTIGVRGVLKGPSDPEKVAQLRKDGATKLADHHHQISRLSSSRMVVGRSMVRDYYVLSEKHFVIEQRITVCMQTTTSKNIFSLLVWMDASRDVPYHESTPWAVKPPASHLLPTIRHRHMNALRCHLFQSRDSIATSATADGAPTRHDQSASFFPEDYGRTLNPETMSRDALYSLNEVFNFTASSQKQFLNLVSLELDRLTSLPDLSATQTLPNLKYIQEILYRHEQKTKAILESITNGKTPRWPKCTINSSGERRARAAVDSLEQDFTHLLKRTETLLTRTAQAIATLMSSISIIESQRGIEQTRRVAKLTFLAFVFVPLSFTTSFFGMNVPELQKLGLKWWGALSVGVLGASLAVFFMSLDGWIVRIWRGSSRVKADGRGSKVVGHGGRRGTSGGDAAEKEEDA